MATISKQDIISALAELGELASEQGIDIDLLVVGGAVMVLLFGERQATRDIDVSILAPANPMVIRRLAKTIAAKRGWNDDWLNDGAKGYLVGLSDGPVLFASQGIIAHAPSMYQLLAMKLSAWRDDVDIADARRILQELKGSYDEVWHSTSPYLIPGNELKAQYAFADLWEASKNVND